MSEEREEETGKEEEIFRNFFKAINQPVVAVYYQRHLIKYRSSRKLVRVDVPISEHQSFGFQRSERKREREREGSRGIDEKCKPVNYIGDACK